MLTGISFVYDLAALLTGCSYHLPSFLFRLPFSSFDLQRAVLVYLDIGPMLVWICVFFSFSAIHVLILTLQVRTQGHRAHDSSKWQSLGHEPRSLSSEPGHWTSGAQ